MGLTSKLQAILEGTTSMIAVAAFCFIFALVYLGRRRTRAEKREKKPSFLTVRISNIPKRLGKGEFHDILRNVSDTLSDTTQSNLLEWSYTPAAASTLSGRFNVATVTFHTAPALDQLEAAFKGKIGLEANRLKVDQDFFGLTPLADPAQQEVLVE